MKHVKMMDFELKQNLIVLNCIVEGEEHAFILDSGAPSVILNRQYQSYSALKSHDGQMKGASGNITEVSQMQVRSLCCGSLEQSNLTALVMDLSHIEESVQGEVYGLIGYDFFRENGLLIDYKNAQIGFVDSNKCADLLTNHQYKSYPFKMEKHLPIIECEINQRIYQFALDTGANMNLIDHNLQTEFANAIDYEETSHRLVDASTEQKNTTHITGYIKDVNIAGLGHYTNMKSVFLNIDHLNQNTSFKIDGILGYEFLSKNKTMINFPNSKLYVLL